MFYFSSARLSFVMKLHRDPIPTKSIKIVGKTIVWCSSADEMKSLVGKRIKVGARLAEDTIFERRPRPSFGFSVAR